MPLLFLASLWACSDAPPSPPSTAPTAPEPSTSAPPSAPAGAVVKLPSIDGIEESSGVGWSRDQEGVWITHEDSGSDPVLHRFDLSGARLESRVIRGAEAVDWEDMAIAPCPGGEGSCVYIADIGDNKQARSEVTVYAVPESGDEVIARWRYRYPEGPLNAETLLAHPETGRLYVVSKDRGGHSQIFRLPEAPGDDVAVAEKVGDLTFEGESKSQRYVTAGDWSPDGKKIVLRTYVSAYLWDVDPAAPEAHWTTPPRRCFLPYEEQGESVAWTPEGELLTTSEEAPMTVHRTRCGDRGAR